MNNNIISLKYKDLHFIKSTVNENNVYNFYKKIPNSIRTCPNCNSNMYICSHHNTNLRDFPILPKKRSFVIVSFSRFRCDNCKHCENDDILIKHKNTRITKLCALWIKELLDKHTTVNDIHKITGVHWSIIRKIHKEEIDIKLKEREKYLKSINYKPKYIAVDEFAILKGHKYATVVLDLELGDIIWVGLGRSKEDFSKFFTKDNIEYLSELKAVAVDMSVSYNQVIEKYLPNVEIVYDRYHILADYGKNVIGQERLNVASENKEKAYSIRDKIKYIEDIEEKRKLNMEYRYNIQEYSLVKNSRWLLLRNSKNLTSNNKTRLDSILEKHESIAICYAMKEEMNNIFSITNNEVARSMWENWFKAAKESNVLPLFNFAMHKEKRIEGLISYSKHRISTSRLEGINNKIKVCKRMAYGYRNIKYFFSLLMYLMLPKEYS